jgi:hypothetical protein
METWLIPLICLGGDSSVNLYKVPPKHSLPREKGIFFSKKIKIGDGCVREILKTASSTKNNTLGILKPTAPS